MNQPSPIPPPDRPPVAGGADAPLSREARMLRGLLLVGCVSIVVIWIMESVRGVLAPWDRIGYPVLMLMLAAGALVMTRWPRTAGGVRLTAVVVFNAYLLLGLYSILFASDQAPDLYQLMSSLYWLPLGYGTAFVFLSMRAALWLSGSIYLSTFGLIFWHLARGDMPHWPGYLAPMMSNLAVAQIVYVVMLLAISRLREDFHRGQIRIELMRQIAATDPLTGLLNRRALTDHIQAGRALVQRGGQALSVILLDVDHFKQINDRHGHAAGDRVLTHLSALLTEQLRGSDQVGRWGGEEFLIVAPATGLAAAGELAERIRLAVSAAVLAPGQRVTISLGVAECRPGESVDALIQRADRALYAAKGAGRDRVCLAGDEPLSPSALSA